jgi:transcriptional regulator with XRE-family HTH domain
VAHVDVAHEGGRKAEASAELGAFVKRCRARIHPESRSLGPYLRFPTRVGKAVTQEEIAEAAGISRPWYGMLESGRQVRASPTLLSRVADTLMLDAVERAAFFQLAVPELCSTKLQPRSSTVLDAFAPLRSLTRRLWAASSETEALTIVREHGATHYAPDLMMSTVRVGEGRWERPAAIGGPDARRRLETFHAFTRAHCEPAIVEEMNYHPVLAQPGEVLTRAGQPPPSPDLATQFRRALEVIDWPDVDYMVANVRSRSGFIAHIAVVHSKHHPYSETDRAHLSAIAEVTSIALADAPPA